MLEVCGRNQMPLTRDAASWSATGMFSSIERKYLKACLVANLTIVIDQGTSY